MSQSAKANSGGQKPSDGSTPRLTAAQQTREMLESFAVAFILMLLMRNCLGENYQIPTGSMAPTLQGRHMDVVCEQCHYQYRTGASIENEEHGVRRGEVIGTTCPICRFRMDLDKRANPNHRSFSGDRIIVSKLAYWFAEPARWDVIVFKCPADAKTNYIKRLVGLPGETLRIRHGDVFQLDPATAQRPPAQQQFRIVRKPPDKVLGMLQLVDDTRYIPPQLKAVGWPSRWSAVSRTNETEWRYDESRSEFDVQARDDVQWLRYQHIVPRPEDWYAIRNGVKPDLNGYQGMLITDYYAYNDPATDAMNWVGDLALECEVTVSSPQGDVLLELVEGGTHFTCRIDISTGTATLAIGDPSHFRDDQGRQVVNPSASTALRGAGRYHLRFANVDDQLFLWVNEQLAEFSGPTTFDSPPNLVPRWSIDDAGDAMPLGLGVRNANVHVSRLRVLRDVYYLAVSSEFQYPSDYYPHRLSGERIYEILTQPETWEKTDLFATRRQIQFTIARDQYFPLGDNSPQSKDARLWSFKVNGELDPPAAVQRELLIGKAISIYWPHAWYLPALPVWPIVPNYQRIGFIH